MPVRPPPPIDVNQTASSDVPSRVIDTASVWAGDIDLAADSAAAPLPKEASEETAQPPVPPREPSPLSASTPAVWEDPRLFDRLAEVPDDNFLLAFGQLSRDTNLHEVRGHQPLRA